MTEQEKKSRDSLREIVQSHCDFPIDWTAEVRPEQREAFLRAFLKYWDEQAAKAPHIEK